MHMREKQYHLSFYIKQNDKYLFFFNQGNRGKIERKNDKL